MVLFIIQIVIMALLIIITLLTLLRLLRVTDNHMIGVHTTKLVNDGNVNLTYFIGKQRDAYADIVLQNPETKEEIDKLTERSKPLISLEDKYFKGILLFNNVNSIKVLDNSKLMISLNMVRDYYEENGKKTSDNYYMVMNDNLANKNQRLTNEIVNPSFPRVYNIDYSERNVVNLKDLGFEDVVKIDVFNIVTILFNGKSKEMDILTNIGSEGYAYTIKYKSKADIMEKVKNTALGDHILQWGIPIYNSANMAIMNDKEAAEYELSDLLEELLKQDGKELVNGKVTEVQKVEEVISDVITE